MWAIIEILIKSLQVIVLTVDWKSHWKQVKKLIILIPSENPKIPPKSLKMFYVLPIFQWTISYIRLYRDWLHLWLKKMWWTFLSFRHQNIVFMSKILPQHLRPWIISFFFHKNNFVRNDLNFARIDLKFKLFK